MNPEKKLARRNRNAHLKSLRAEARRKADIELGKTVIVTEKDGVKSYAFPPKQKFPVLNIPRLIHITEKTRKTSVPRKTHPGHKPEHTEAFTENASREFAKEVDKALGVEPVNQPVTPSLPMVSPAELSA